MVGSPNYIPMVGTFSTDPSINQTGKPGSDYITGLFKEYFNTVLDTPYQFIALTAGSDHFTFIENGKPAGRIHSGAAQIKTQALRNTYGGIANVQADTCYHQSCDTDDNISDTAIFELSQGMAYVLEKLANDPNLIMKLKSGLPNTLAVEVFEEALFYQ